MREPTISQDAGSQDAGPVTSEKVLPAAVRWRSWPARDNPVHTLLVGLGMLIGGMLISWGSGHWYLTLPAVLALLVSMWRFFLPITFELNDRGVDRWIFGRQRHVAWNAIRRHEICPGGVLLLPHDDRSLLASFRGLYVPWKEHHDAVLQRVKYHLDTQPPM
ncbi:MAG TPA: hypothetical protein VE890_16215 [Thermoguttaceae bacterium]|nr:hypothetical protein [Thermoguttaceae bacterium]